jgi:hypothetical protein
MAWIAQQHEDWLILKVKKGSEHGTKLLPRPILTKIGYSIE